ncbi:UNVERIFIED_CONTAM: Mediator of RNA polymerase II transcription subunit [Sesamum latifolium]|uniref:Mediator of RNA polymerase II transcription subunit 11 n=1 Tax=Sesamum latifolium TaxID=2727402 RepID=A0AAW2WM47_9LAMI
MEEMANPSGPRKELVNNHCSEFMQLVKDIQMTLREEIKSACEYRPFEKCDYVPRISNEICCKKLEYVIAQLDEMKQTVEEYHHATSADLSCLLVLNGCCVDFSCDAFAICYMHNCFLLGFCHILHYGKGWGFTSIKRIARNHAGKSVMLTCHLG